MDFDDEGDGLDEISNAGVRQPPDEAFEAQTGKPRKRLTLGTDGTPCPQSRGDPMRPLALIKYPKSDHLDPSEERDVIRKAKAGDLQARERLWICFNKTCRKVAGQCKYDGPDFEDKLDVAIEGLLKALRGYDPHSNNGFYAYAIKFIEGSVADYVHDWHRKGSKGETRDERKDRSANRPIHVQYNGVEQRRDEGGRDADGEPRGNKISGCIAGDRVVVECDKSGGRITDADWDLIVAGRAVPTNWPNSRAPKEPCRPINRKRYEEDQRQVYRCDEAKAAQYNFGFNWLRKGGVDPNRKKQLARLVWNDTNSFRNGRYAGAIQYLAKDTDERALRRLKQVGRVQYAQELAAKDAFTMRYRPLQLHRDVTAKPTQLRPAKKWRTETDLKQVRYQIAGGVPYGRINWKLGIEREQALAERALRHAIKWAEGVSNKSKLRIIEGMQNGKFNHPGTINHVGRGDALHRHDRGSAGDVRKVNRAIG